MKTVGFFGGKFLIPHRGHLHVMMMASTIVDELHVIVSYDTRFEQDVLFKDAKVSHIDYKQRVRWWKELTKDMPHVFVHAIEETNDGQFSSWEDGADKIKSAVGKDITHVFSSEHSYTDYFDILYPDAKHMVIDSERERYPISATKIRNEGVMKNWDMIPKVVQKYFVKKVVVIGTESTGKSTLVKNLATLYNTNYVEEYGRKYFEELGSYETFEEDYLKIAYGHKYKEEQGLKDSNRILFIDTEALVTERFLMTYHGKRNELLESVSKSQKYDLYLFLEPDVEWVDDGTRNLGDEKVRNEGNELLKQLLDSNGVHYVSIKGNYNQRLHMAIDEIDNMIFEEC